MSSEKTVKTNPAKANKIIDEVFDEYQEKKGSLNNTNALVKADVTNQLALIEEQLKAIVDKQNKGVSAEFNALMDGYVNKANESQEFKVKSTHVETLYEELKLEFKTVKEENKRLKTDFEATKDALRMSESDIKRFKNETEHAKIDYENQIKTLKEDQEQLKFKLKEVQGQNDENIQNYNNIKSELLEQKYKVRQLEQEKQVEDEAQERTGRETSKLIDELKEKLELRTREVEYKDALLNQLIKQVSVEDSVSAKLNVMQANNMNSPKPRQFFEEEISSPQRMQVADDMDYEEYEPAAPEPAPQTKQKSLKETITSRFSKRKTSDTKAQSMSWGPFKRK